jgi:hypothetical protein
MKGLLILGVLLVSTLLLASPVAAATTVVNGQVTDESGPVEGASVIATCGGETLSDTTDAEGKYYLYYPSDICGEGATVTVEASKDGKSGSGEGTVVGLTAEINVALVNVSIGIPEFTTVAIPAILTLGGYLATRRRRRKIE